MIVCNEFRIGLSEYSHGDFRPTEYNMAEISAGRFFSVDKQLGD